MNFRWEITNICIVPQDAHNDKNYIIEQSLFDDKIQKMPQQIS